MEDRGMPTERERYLQEKQGYFTHGQWPATCDGGTLTDEEAYASLLPPSMNSDHYLQGHN